MKKIVLFCYLMFCVGCSLSVTEVQAESNENNSVIQPYAAIKGWRYKSENGKYYKRLYNYSTGKWEGNWILVS